VAACRAPWHPQPIHGGFDMAWLSAPSAHRLARVLATLAALPGALAGALLSGSPRADTAVGRFVPLAPRRGGAGPG
jgi:hypothetical protein